MAGRGGKRAGAGRPAGSGWRPARKALSEKELKRCAEIIDEQDPLSVVVGFACDANLDVQTRLSAASIALPYLYPRLSATQVDARVTNVSVDAAAVIEKISARLERMGMSVPAIGAPLFEEQAKDDGKS